MSQSAAPDPRAPLAVPTCVVISGAEAGAFYVRQLLRAIRAGRLRCERIVVVDRDPDCRARVLASPPAELATASWDDWLDEHLGALGPADQLVPYHWAPHLLVGWLRREAQRSGRSLERDGLPPPPGVPFERETREGDRALSYATWPCPPACIEPALCPHTRGPRDWSLAGDLERVPPGFDDAIVFRSLHLAYGVAAIPVADIHAARARILARAERPRRFAIATASHCHGLAASLLSSPGWTPRT